MTCLSIAMRELYFRISVLILTCWSTGSYGQLGPGGVSVETGTLNGCGGSAESTCGVWLDASTLTSIANGDNVTNWPDVSTSADCDNATVPGGALPPIYRNDPSGTINGLPTITFADGKYFVLSSSDDLNTTRVTYDKMVFLAFRTSEDVNTKQTVYEEGGTVRGFNIMIDDGLVIVGAYDKQVDNDGGVSGNSDNTPAWGYSYVSRTIQPNTTYILTAQFKATTPGVIGNNANYFLRGWLNGVSFGGPGALVSDGSFSGFPGNNQVGSLFDHPNPCGVGAVNDDTVDREQVVNNGSGSWPFKGKLAELCYYKDETSETQRIIIENYLASKYVANIVQNDFYSYEFLYGKDLIGVGRIVNPESHNLSQGRNPFRISAQTLSTSANQFCMMAHNGANNAWTDEDVPNDSENIERLERVWRVDRSNFVSSLNFEVDEDKLPAPPSGYNSSNARLVLLIDQTNQFLPDFSESTTIVRELSTLGATAPFDYESIIDFADGAFFTFAWLKPEVNLVLDETFELEDDPAPAQFTTNYQIQLNYSPIGNIGGYDVTYTLQDISATRGVDYDFGDGVQTTATINIPVNQNSVNIPVQIINDDVAEDPSTELFRLILMSGSPSLTIGQKDTLDVTIYDDDPDPKFTFSNAASIVNENVGTHNVTILRTGDTDGVASLRVRTIGANTTALSSASGDDPDDYDFTNFQVINFASGQSSATVSIDINDDVIDEEDSENVRLRIYNFIGDVAAGNILDHDVEIVDNDIPIASFASPSQSGSETQSAPSLLVTLDPISSRVVTVDFSMFAGTATITQDFDGASSGFVTFAPFTDEAFIGPFFVYTDADDNEGPETVDFEISVTTPEGGSGVATFDELTYIITDYTEFEWKGIAGVGEQSDNIIWIDAMQESLGDAATLANRSPLVLDIDQQPNPATVIANGINGHQALDFNGSGTPANADVYEIENSDKINTAGTVDKLSYFFTFLPDVVPTPATTNTANTTNSRLIYEQGGGTRGTSIYLYNNRLYFHAWNNADDDGGDDTMTTDTIEGNQAPWGHDGTSSRSYWARSAQDIIPGQAYIVSCHYENFSSEPLKVYVNGRKGGTNSSSAPSSGYNSFGVGRLWGHAGLIGLGAPINGSRYHFWNGSPSDRSSAFDGKIGEFISFHEPQLNEARRVIIENYLSAKWDIELTGTDTPQIWDLNDSEQGNFSNQVAAVGRAGTSGGSHNNSEGPNAILQVKVNDGDLAADSYIAWGHNNESLINSWPVSDPDQGNVLPAGIQERSGQVWKFFETGTVPDMDVLINFSASANADTLVTYLPNTYLKLLVHSNTDPQDFSNATVYDADNILSGGVAQFLDIPVTNGMYIALGNTSDYLNVPLPIELFSFDARLNEPVVNIDWSTATETNNDYFVVERAGDDLVWKSIMQVQGAGNSSSMISYHEVDREPLNGVSYYRLKQVDFDGHFEYSDVVSVLRTGKQVENDLYIFPNPSSIGSVFVSIPGERSDEVIGDISLYNIAGTKVWEERAVFSGGQYELNYGDMPAGVYLIQVQTQEYNLTKKLVVR